MSITDSKYASWLEGVVGMILTTQPERIGICLMGQEYNTTCYFGDCNHADKAAMAHEFTVDSMMDVMTANADMIAAAAQEIEDEEYTLTEEDDDDEMDEYQD